MGQVRRNSATELLLLALPGAPLVTVQSAAALIGRSAQAVNEAIPRLVEAGVLKQITVGVRNRAFEAPELIDSFTALERQSGEPRRGHAGVPVRTTGAVPAGQLTPSTRRLPDGSADLRRHA